MTSALFRGYWLKEPSIGFGKIFFWCLLIIICCLIQIIWLKNIFGLFLTLVITTPATLFLLNNLVHKGYYHRLKKLKSLGCEIEVIDYILPSNNHQNIRKLSVKKKASFYSEIFLHPRKVHPVGFYDYFRIFAQRYTPKVKKVLVLGGGGLSVPISLASNFPQITIDVVEIDPEIIKISKKYFLQIPQYKKLEPKINLIQKDAFKFIQKNNSRQYQLIFCDLFVGNLIPDQVFSHKFLQQLGGFLDHRGLLMVNAGFNQVNLSGKLATSLARTFQRVFVYLINKNFVVLIPGKDLKINPCLDINNSPLRSNKVTEELRSMFLWQIERLGNNLFLKD